MRLFLLILFITVLIFDFVKAIDSILKDPDDCMLNMLLRGGMIIIFALLFKS